MIKQEHRKYIAALVVWFVIANLMYFSNIKEMAHLCSEMPGWLPLWIPFTFGIKELFPYFIQTHTPKILFGAPMEDREWVCSQNFFFDEVGYAYFLLMPVAIVIGSYLLHKWTFNKSNSVTHSE